MQLYEEIDNILQEIEIATDMIRSIFDKSDTLTDNDIDQIAITLEVRGGYLEELKFIYDSADITAEQKMKINEFVNSVKLKEQQNLERFDAHIKFLGSKIRLLNKQKNLKIYTQWSQT